MGYNVNDYDFATYVACNWWMSVMMNFQMKSLLSENGSIAGEYAMPCGFGTFAFGAGAASSINFAQTKNMQKLSKLKKRMARIFGQH